MLLKCTSEIANLKLHSWGGGFEVISDACFEHCSEEAKKKMPRVTPYWHHFYQRHFLMNPKRNKIEEKYFCIHATKTAMLPTFCNFSSFEKTNFTPLFPSSWRRSFDFDSHKIFLCERRENRIATERPRNRELQASGKRIEKMHCFDVSCIWNCLFYWLFKSKLDFVCDEAQTTLSQLYEPRNADKNAICKKLTKNPVNWPQIMLYCGLTRSD